MLIGILLDLIIVAIIAICVVFSAKRGFMRTLLEVVGFIAAFVIAFTVSSPLADMTYDNIVEPSIVSTVEESSTNVSGDVSEKVWNTLPGVIRKNSQKFGIKKDAFSDKVKSYVSGEVEQNAVKISQNVTKPIIVKLIGAIYSTVIVILLIFVSKFLARVINKLFSFSIIGKLNSFFGGVIGVFKGAAFALAFCMIISIVVLVSNDSFWIFTTDNIEKTHLFKLFYGISPFV